MKAQASGPAPSPVWVFHAAPRGAGRVLLSADADRVSKASLRRAIAKANGSHENKRLAWQGLALDDASPRRLSCGVITFLRSRHHVHVTDHTRQSSAAPRHRRRAGIHHRGRDLAVRRPDRELNVEDVSARDARRSSRASRHASHHPVERKVGCDALDQVKHVVQARAYFKPAALDACAGLLNMSLTFMTFWPFIYSVKSVASIGVLTAGRASSTTVTRVPASCPRRDCVYERRAALVAQ